MNIEENIFKAINIIAKRIVDKTPRDVTVIGTIYPGTEEEYKKNQYRVKYGDVYYLASAINYYDGYYLEGELVYMLIPQNDRSNTKFILGRVEPLPSEDLTPKIQ